MMVGGVRACTNAPCQSSITRPSIPLSPKVGTSGRFGDRVAVLIHDKALLDEEDIFSAKLLIYGKSDGALVKAIGPRWFMTPGPVGGPGCGAIDHDASDDQLIATVYDADGRTSRTETRVSTRATKMSVQG